MPLTQQELKAPQWNLMWKHCHQHTNYWKEYLEKATLL